VPLDLLYTLREGNTERLEQGGTQVDSILGAAFAFIASLAVLADARSGVGDLHPLVAVTTAPIYQVGYGHDCVAVRVGIAARPETGFVIGGLAVVRDALLERCIFIDGRCECWEDKGADSNGEECEAGHCKIFEDELASVVDFLYHYNSL